jgi:hypothetical protein
MINETENAARLCSKLLKVLFRKQYDERVHAVCEEFLKALKGTFEMI